MTSRMTIVEATAALDDAIARHKSAEKAAADLYGDVIAAREALNAAYAEEDKTLPQCTVSAEGVFSSGTTRYKMVILERGDGFVCCRRIGSRDGHVTLKWNDKECAYIARGIGGHRGICRTIVAFDGDDSA